MFFSQNEDSAGFETAHAFKANPFRTPPAEAREEARLFPG